MAASTASTCAVGHIAATEVGNPGTAHEAGSAGSPEGPGGWRDPARQAALCPGAAAIVALMDFRIARAARDRYGFDEHLFSADGEAIVVDPERAMALAERFVAARDARARAATEIAAVGLIHELGHRAVATERRRAAQDAGPLARGLAALDVRLGRRDVDGSLASFETAFPSLPVYRDELTVVGWLAQPRGNVPGREAALEELALATLGAANPAAAAYRELIDDACLSDAAQRRVIDALAGADLPPHDPDSDRAAPARSLLHRLREPFVAAPHSLAAQLRWIRLNWAGWLEEADLELLDRSLIVLADVERAAWLRAHRAPGPGGEEDHRAGLAGLDEEPEAFSSDRDWMAELVLVAKSTYVWLAQLSRTYGREIRRLDQIPDEELDELRARGFTGLWLIGLWERSPASRRIKQMRGNPDAMASAYSVADYHIADELGGDDAWRSLRDRAGARGLRLAADMVPNHMGIDSSWVIEHPERFISLPYPPFEAYTFSGADLSSDERATIQIEDHYWDSSDAAVVFKRIDRASGEVRYIYHGNDGTSFPWNDTAQLDYLDAEVREAVIGQILDVARRFHVIRFDAAMVLARRHIQRLWYPLPGHEAGIPSRSAAALPAAELTRRMPAEFWREVVDRVAAEVPDTLLLAEAFWLMEGYFVRTLGMHRVYNSAFMHMLRDEKNAGYQQVIRDTVAFDSRILGRYVNFMNNPDERSAVDQFGSHDKYFGVATLLATLPGLPMFGHGQVEGYSEQYGMEFRRPQRDETPDEELVERHRREVFPLLRQRWRFAGATHFRQLTALEGGAPVADAFAFANRAEHGPADASERRSLVVYLNRFPRAHVRIPGVAEVLGLGGGDDDFVILRDERRGLDFLRGLRDLREHGLELSLDGYACHVFLGFSEVSGADGAAWGELAMRLGLDGIPDARMALRRLREEPIRAALAGLIGSRAVEDVCRLTVTTVGEMGLPSRIDGSAAGTPDSGAPDLDAPEMAAGTDTNDLADLEPALRRLADAVGTSADVGPAARRLSAALVSARALHPRSVTQAVVGWAVGRAMGEIACEGDPERTADAFDAWEGASPLEDVARRAGSSDAQAWRSVELARCLLVLPVGALESAAAGSGLPEDWFERPAVRVACGWNAWQGATYVSQEGWLEVLEALAARDGRLLGHPAASAAASRLAQRAAARGYRISGSPSLPGGGAEPMSGAGSGEVA